MGKIPMEMESKIENQNAMQEQSMMRQAPKDSGRANVHFWSGVGEFRRASIS